MLQLLTSKLRRSTLQAVQIGQRFRLRRTPTGASYAIADSASMLHPEHWDSLTASSSVFMSRKYLAVLDAHRPEDVRQHAVLVYLDGQPVAPCAPPMREERPLR